MRPTAPPPVRSETPIAAGITDDLTLRMAAIETRRATLEREIGRHAAVAEALRELNEALLFERQALERHPYGHGHTWNEWAIQVAIEKLRHESRWR